VKAATVMNKWIWSSGMKGEEIHGEISNDGWTNIKDNNIQIDEKFYKTGFIDDEAHIVLNAKTLLGWTDKARIELAKL